MRPRLGQKGVQVKPRVHHGKAALRIARPVFGCPITVNLDPVAIGIAKIDRLGYPVIGSTIQRHTRLKDARQSRPKGCTIRIEECRVVKPGMSMRGRVPPTAFPCVQTDVMMIPPRREKRGLITVVLLNLKAHDIAVKGDGAFQIGHFQVNMSNAGFGMCGISCHGKPS